MSKNFLNEKKKKKTPTTAVFVFQIKVCKEKSLGTTALEEQNTNIKHKIVKTKEKQLKEIKRVMEVQRSSETDSLMWFLNLHYAVFHKNGHKLIHFVQSKLVGHYLLALIHVNATNSC